MRILWLVAACVWGLPSHAGGLTLRQKAEWGASVVEDCRRGTCPSLNAEVVSSLMHVIEYSWVEHGLAESPLLACLALLDRQQFAELPDALKSLATTAEDWAIARVVRKVRRDRLVSDLDRELDVGPSQASKAYVAMAHGGGERPVPTFFIHNGEIPDAARRHGVTDLGQVELLRFERGDHCVVELEVGRLVLERVAASRLPQCAVRVRGTESGRGLVGSCSVTFLALRAGGGRAISFDQCSPHLVGPVRAQIKASTWATDGAQAEVYEVRYRWTDETQ